MGHCNLSCEADDVELSARCLQNKKKRKYPQIVRNRDKVSNLCSNNNNNNGISSRKKSTNVLSTGGFRILTKEDRPLPQVKSVVDVVSGDGLSSFLLDGGHNKLELEDCARSHNIGSCRWVNYADESVISDAPTDQGFLKRKQKPVVDVPKVDMGARKKATLPQSVELKQERFQKSREKSYVSDKGSNRSSCSRTNKFAKKDLGDDHYMETNEERNNGDTSVRHSNNNSQDECSFCDTPEPAAPLQRRGSMFQTCRSIDEFESLKQIGEGTYGIVYKAKNKITGETVALKKFKMGDNDEEGFPLTTLREINILHSLNHSSIIGLKEVVVGTGDYIFLVMECMDHDLKAVMDTKKQPFGQSVVKRLMLQLLEGVKYLHHNWILHRDLKPSNLLINSCNELKICDLGMARRCGTPLQPYTEVVVTLWYRAPELLLGKKQYSSAIDMWSVGCIMAELLLNRPLFHGMTEIDQINNIFKILGTPNETSWPGFSKLPKGKVKFVGQPDNLLRKIFPATSFTGSPALSNAGFDLLSKLLTYDPEKRMTAEEALNHQWFREVTFSQV